MDFSCTTLLALLKLAIRFLSQPTVSQGAGRRGGCEQLGVRALGVVGLYLISVCVVLCVLVQERALDVRVM